MRPAFSERVERGRVLFDPRAPQLASSHGDDFGFFFLRTNAGEQLSVMISAGTEEVPWEHVSVSHRRRCPTWEEMAWVKSLFFEDEEAVMQLHPPKSEYVNFHEHCLHLWRPLPGTNAIPLPPSIAVGPKEERRTA